MFLTTVAFVFSLISFSLSNDEMEIAKTYLTKYGYLPRNNHSESEFSDGSQLTESIIKFQEYFKLHETGTLNRETIELMRKPRCGVADFSESYVTRSKWMKKHIKWKFLRGNQDDENIASKSFEIWSVNSGLTFSRGDKNPDILIKYSSHKHNMSQSCEGNRECSFPFDGPGIVLGHAYFPDNNRCVEIHIDKDEKWFKRLGPPNPGFTSLYFVLVHEIGHALGLLHSADDKAIMSPYYSEDDIKNNILPQDDLNGIQSLYGFPNNPHTQPSIKPTQTLKRTTQTKPSQTTEKSIENYIKPNLCIVKNKIERIVIINNHIYLLYNGWVWTISLKDKIIHPPLKAIEYMPIGNIDFKKDSIQIYQRPNNEIILFHHNYFYRIDSNSFGVIESRDYKYIGLPRDMKVHGVLNTYKGKTYIFYNNFYCAEIDESTLLRKSVKYISEVFPGIPNNFTSVFRYIDGTIYFIKDNMVYEFNEFLNKATGSYKFEIETLLKIPCQSDGLLQSLKNLLSMIITNQIIISNTD